MIALSSVTCLIAGLANAATITSDPAVPLDFGNVEVGQSSTIQLTLTFSYENLQSLETMGTTSKGAFTATELPCSDLTSGVDEFCRWDFTFAPTALGDFSEGFFNALTIRENLANSGTRVIFYDIRVSGSGIAATAVPLPAGLPLLAAGLGAFALMRRKQRG